MKRERDSDEGDLVHRVARRLAAARRERGLSQEGLAALLDISVKNLQRMESGKQNLSLATVERVCRALGVPPEGVLGGKAGSMEPPSLPHVLERLARAGYRVRAATERGRRPSHAVPVMTLRAAAGQLTGVARSIEVTGWVIFPRSGEPPEGQFIAEVRGDSMAPKIPSGALCLFSPPRPPPFESRVLLVAHESFVDSELGGPYALKRIKATKKLRDGRTRVVLESINPAFPPFVVVASEDELQVIAELVRVLAAGAP